MKHYIEAGDKKFLQLAENIGIMPLIKDYGTMKLNFVKYNRKFENFSIMLKVNNKITGNIGTFYQEAVNELQKMKSLSIALDGLIGSLKIVANEEKQEKNTITNVSNLFKKKLAEYSSSFYKFKNIFSILKTAAADKPFTNGKTR